MCTFVRARLYYYPNTGTDVIIPIHHDNKAEAPSLWFSAQNKSYEVYNLGNDQDVQEILADQLVVSMEDLWSSAKDVLAQAITGGGPLSPAVWDSRPVSSIHTNQVDLSAVPPWQLCHLVAPVGNP